jgi:ribosomal protein S18 acetylase RimI-like enzyme
MKTKKFAMDYIIRNASVADSLTIYRLFEEAIRFQKENRYTGWNNYDKEFIQSDIQKGLLFKIIRGEQIVCIFSICYRDELIWREMEKGNAVYLHRTVVDQQFKGKKIFQKVLDWAVKFALEKRLKYVRMDTWADNEKIIGYYKSYGFTVIENYTTPDTNKLPEQHRNLKVALLELAVKPGSANNGLNTTSNTSDDGAANRPFDNSVL